MIADGELAPAQPRRHGRRGGAAEVRSWRRPRELDQPLARAEAVRRSPAAPGAPGRSSRARPGRRAQGRSTQFSAAKLEKAPSNGVSSGRVALAPRHWSSASAATRRGAGPAATQLGRGDAHHRPARRRSAAPAARAPQPEGVLARAAADLEQPRAGGNVLARARRTARRWAATLSQAPNRSSKLRATASKASAAATRRRSGSHRSGLEREPNGCASDGRVPLRLERGSSGVVGAVVALRRAGRRAPGGRTRWVGALEQHGQVAGVLPVALAAELGLDRAWNSVPGRG